MYIIQPNATVFQIYVDGPMTNKIKHHWIGQSSIIMYFLCPQTRKYYYHKISVKNKGFYIVKQ